jgi:Lecithin:cholesterol acyltransferase
MRYARGTAAGRRSCSRTSAFPPVLAGLAAAALATAAPVAADPAPAADPVFDGAADAPVASPPVFRQLLHEERAASAARGSWLSPADLREIAGRSKGAPVPVAVVDAPASAEESATGRVFLANALKPYSYRGARVEFRVSAATWIGDAPDAYVSIRLDCDDGRGWRAPDRDGVAVATWNATGGKVMRLRATLPDGTAREAAFPFDVRALGTPAPDDTLHVTASVPYLGTAGSADAYVYRAPGHASIVNPIVVVEGFDLADTYDWEELYALLNQENLIETLRSLGYDAVVINFHAATDYLQRSAFVVAETLAQVHAMTSGPGDIALIGASMGGLLSRYALAWMEDQGQDAHVRTFISFDSPQKGASIPLGIQYWVDFFASQSADAAFLLDRLDTPGARQMLLYHHTDPPTSAPQADPLRAQFLGDLAALGDWPAVPRLVAVANGSGAGMNQGFAAGNQIIDYNYNIGIVNVRGNVWAVPDGGSGQIFDGRLFVLFTLDETQSVTVSGTLPWDSAPGGYRGSMAEMDATEAPFGDIVALHDNHCFVPTISSLALDVTDPFYDVDGDPDLLAISPFDAVYFPATNQEHIFIDAQSAAWFLSEIDAGTTGAGEWTSPGGPIVLDLLSAGPNPFRGSTSLRFRLAAPRRVTAEVFDVGGRRVASLLHGEPMGAGTHELRWPAGADGTRAPAGVYWVRLDAGDRAVQRRVVRLD